jgi:adenylate cyclase
MADGQKTRVLYPIGAKLVTIITVLLLVSLSAITTLVSVMVSRDVRITAEDNNFTINQRSAAEAELTLSMIRSNVLALLDSLRIVESRGVADQLTVFFFERNQDIAAIVITGDREPLINPRFFTANELDPSLIGDFTAAESGAAERCRRGEALFLNAAPVFGVPCLAMFYPWREEGSEEAVIILFSTESMVDIFGAGANASYLVNDAGDILVSADYDMVKAGTNIADISLIQTMRTSPERNLQALYTDNNGERFFGAFQKLSIGNTAVITSVQYDVVFEGIAATTRRNMYLTGAVLFISIFFIWFFSKTISGPLKNLAAAAGRIEQGEFELTLKSKSHDELGLLTDSFVKMGRGLAERERLKDTFGRFTNREIAERAMRGELALGGENKEATIFFSDIRSFTAISEKLKPDEVVEFLNDYMTRMVDCVDKTGGVVDKFIGDAVMAVWGAPVSAGSPVRDALNCVRAALMMRSNLREFNRDRGGDKKPIIRIGCGINTGEVVAGQIGSSRRMEYTVIGDAVNLASRTEALNKPLGTDILITENTWELVGKYLITEEMPPVSVKGKEKPVRMFAVVNMKVTKPGESQPKPVTLAEVRGMLGIEAPDLSKVDTGAEEKKYKIGGTA